MDANHERDRSGWPSRFISKIGSWSNPNFGTGRDRPSWSFKIFELSREKSGFTRFCPTFPHFPWLFPTLPDFSWFFYLKMPGKIEENSGEGILTRPEFWDGSGCPTRSRSRSQFVKKSGWPSLSRSRPDPTRPDPTRPDLTRPDPTQLWLIYFPPWDISPILDGRSAQMYKSKNSENRVSKFWVYDVTNLAYPKN